MTGENGDAGDDLRANWVRLLGAVAATQDREAFAQLFEHFAPRVKSYMLRSGASEPGAEELAQETMLRVWRKAHLFDPSQAAVSTWVFTIARNLRIDAARRERRGEAPESLEAEAEFAFDPAPLPDARLAAAEAHEVVRRALTKLSADQRRIVEMSFFEDRAHAEIARILEIPLGTAKSRLRLALQRLRGLVSALA
jgi:RNA polymerase sigma-70 factor (ECF subfamily)